MPGTNEDDGRRGLARSLLALRISAGLRQVEVAERTGLTQARLSRAENGHALLTPDEVATLAELYGARTQERAELVRNAREAQSEYVDARVVLQRGSTANLQRRYSRLERNAAEVRAFQPMMVLGVLQTTAYAAVVFGTGVEDQLVRDRMRRQRRMLEDDGRRWLLIQTEGSLRWHVRSPALMAEQIEHVITLTELPNVEIGIIGWKTAIDVFPSTAFHLYDRSTVVVATNDGTAIMEEAAAVADYRRLFDRLSAAAVTGDRARAALVRIVEDYRSHSGCAL